MFREGLVLAAALVLAPAWVSAQSYEGVPVARSEEPSDGRRTLRALPANVGRGVVGVFNTDNLPPLLVGAALAGLGSIWDDDLHEAANPDSGFSKALETAGGWPSMVLVAGLFTAGRFTHEERFRAMSYDLLDATAVNFGYTSLLKLVIRRERPDGSNHRSFPSGHAAHAFTLATVVERHYGWRAGVPAYALAAGIGGSRVVQDKHYLSDVVAGATLGYIVGQTVVRVNGEPSVTVRSAVLQVSPAIGRRERRVTIAFSF